MHRLQDHTCIPAVEQRDELALVEPQLGFSRDAAIWFDPTLRDGSGPKWHALERIGVPGPWQQNHGWLPWKEVDVSPAPDAVAWAEAGLVLRLHGEAQDERFVDEDALWRLRFASILRFTRRIDAECVVDALARNRYRCWLRLNSGVRVVADEVFVTMVQRKAAEPFAGDLPWERICWLPLDAALNCWSYL